MSSSEIFSLLEIAGSLSGELRDTAQDLSEQWGNLIQQNTDPKAPPLDAATYLNLMLRAERMAKYEVTRSQGAIVPAEHERLMQENPWLDIPPLPGDALPRRLRDRLETRLGEKMLEHAGEKEAHPLRIPEDKNPLIETALTNRRAVETAVQYYLNRGVMPDIVFDDADFDTVLLNSLASDTKGTALDRAKALGEFTAFRLDSAYPHLRFLRSEEPEASAGRNIENFKAYTQGTVANRNARINNEMPWMLTKIPSEADARRDGFASYGEYLDYFFARVEQPYGDIFASQSKYIAAFNKGADLHFTNNDGTDVHVAIQRDGMNMKFANSSPGRNLPGSEFFSGPTSVDGVVVAKGNFAYELGGRVLEMKNLRLEFKSGQVVSATAEEGQENLDAILAVPGARGVGEIGIGTNPDFRKHLVNGLLVEKISGSFHLALGEAYKDRYLDQDVKMDNGSRSDVHWDITTMLRGKDGKMTLSIDDKHYLVQDNGEWLPIPELGITEKDTAVLNTGWRAISPGLRPSPINELLSLEGGQSRQPG